MGVEYLTPPPACPIPFSLREDLEFHVISMILTSVIASHAMTNPHCCA